jgi:tRNA(Ile)-lysidine synthase
MGKNEKFLKKFENFVLKHQLIKKDDKIMVGFSGGADSTSLLLALWHLKSQYNFSILAVHINYNLRGNDSLKDEEFVKKFCFDRNISLVIKSIKMKSKKNLENNAREIRFNYFNKLVKSYKVTKIALGHNISDHAETMIFRMFRGAGYAGIKGITPKSGILMHPLISFTRQEITDFLEEENIQWREDVSNKNNNFTRNKIRNELLPWIKENLNSKVIEKIYLTGSIFSETDEILRDLARRKIFTSRLKHSKYDFSYSLNILRKVKPVIRFYIYKEIFGLITGSEKDFYHYNFEEIESIIFSSGSKKISLPNNVNVLKEYNDLIFIKKDVLEKVDVNNHRKISTLRNRLTFEDNRIIMKKLKKIDHKHNLYEDKSTIYIDLDKSSFPIVVRHRQPGDKFYPLGMEHPKKIKDFFIDEKVPKFERDKVLIFCDKNKIIWVAGLRVDNRVAITSKTNNILKIKIEKISFKKARAAERIKKRK